MQLTDCMQFRTMSAVWLQLGQCGNQLGLEWWQLLTNENAAHQESDRYPFFARDGKLSALCVDSEPKVIRKLQKQIKKGVFRDSNLILGQSGRGNNWAYGLGARLCEAIRDEYPLGYILSVTVAPHQAGESPLQHYNSLLSLSWLQRISMGMEPWELLRSVCPNPTMKFLYTAQACKRGTAFWDSLISSVVHTLPRESASGQPHFSTSVLAVARSNQDNSFLLSQNSVLLKLKQAYRCVTWNPFPVDCWIDFKNIIDPGHHSHSLTVCANHSSVIDLLEWVTEKAQVMYKAHAYLHWYWKYGCEEEDFQQAFDTLQSVMKDYSSVEH
ncbi:tubulin delta chain-like isoform X3 [Rhinatrema bivittatum]|uniref:tubulin delta chain-like isoform X3 n=1 Tax=Rhinatrema bivittatum TaxID=194408 RepID=UPI00112A8D00|nr:tubulin delta chain-like isoform X3 [Rhinatrema bivittatum]